MLDICQASSLNEDLLCADVHKATLISLGARTGLHGMRSLRFCKGWLCKHLERALVVRTLPDYVLADPEADGRQSKFV